ncbi:hypothetical protein GCM10010289_81020 [Streptomyces violascens]|uniref:Uncharacterized protein n=1 Tax=Streptomyces violascens TaxID=67381 RepID=A0ABQ3QRM5_9ACTN|nr:hypothetical protein GCM10010289_81020 [Streptomyces violascens]GHI39922.1 hypothetical protein Sviol_43300 [Streptomyces violascens]
MPVCSGVRPGGTRDRQAFTRGPAALAQYAEREQRTVIPGRHTERITLDGQEHDVQLAQLTELGTDWAQDG